MDHVVDVDELLFSYAERLRRTTTLQIGTSAISGGQVRAAEMDVMRIIENLGSNAARHATSTVDLSVSEGEHWVEVAVTDDGPGVPEESRAAIFERFYRSDPDRSRADGGAGLGLAIVSELTAKYGGTVHVEGAQPRGARFVVRLPASTPVGHEVALNSAI